MFISSLARPLPLLLALCSAAVSVVRADSALDASLAEVTPEVTKWATVCVVTRDAAGAPVFTWHDYRDTGRARDFWPASTVKLYTAVAALELLHAKGMPVDTTVTYLHQTGEGEWVTDCARTAREMLGEVFARSSNEDYTLLLRLTGVDGINTRFFIPEKGFRDTALMRGYVLERPYVYQRDEAQRMILRGPDGRTETVEHSWSGHSYAADKGATVIDPKTANVTTTRELAECLRRILYHEYLPEAERFRISPEMLDFLRHGSPGATGLENKGQKSGPFAWTGTKDVFPEARFYHKCGQIANYALEVAAVDASARGGPEYILVPAAAAGSATKPVNGETIIAEMSRRIARWAAAPR